MIITFFNYTLILVISISIAFLIITMIVNSIYTFTLSMNRAKIIIYRKIKWWQRPFFPIIFILKVIPLSLTILPKISLASKRKVRLEKFISTRQKLHANRIKERKARFTRHIISTKIINAISINHIIFVILLISLLIFLLNELN